MKTKKKAAIAAGIIIIGCVCGYVLHPHNYKQVEALEPTCTETGTATFRCWCGKTYSEEIPATGHAYTEETTKKASCTEAGEKTFTCSVCGDSYSESIEALGHDYVINTDSVDADNCAVQICSRCGDEIKAEHAFGYSETDKGKDYRCENCDYVLFSVESLEEPKTMYVISSCDTFDQPLKDATKVTTLGTNTAVTVTGTSGDWSEVEIDGGYYFIKSNLLSDTQTKTQTQTASQSQLQTQTQPQAQSQPQTQPQGGNSSQADAELLQKLAEAGYDTSSAWNGQVSGTTGSTGIGDDSNIHFE